ncbi:MAG: M20/M25/M40 family metallo-hydrolase [Vicinamibacterales bacterium]|jgi:glutamate carboxypeptidase|nr:M20/M25/M40 family metallo-hydrolase [Vicinamibacterales bacterium]
MRSLLAYSERELPWLLETIEALVRLESPSGDAVAINRCQKELEFRLSGLGGVVTRRSGGPAGDHVRAEFGSGPRQVLLLGHIDTVWPVGTLAARPFCAEGGRLHGPGVFDMKAGLAIAALALKALAEGSGALPGTIVLLVTADEETGSAASRAVIEAEALASVAVLVLEPALPGGALKTSRKGCGEFVLRVSGRAAHAGIEPETGASAVSELARQIPRIEALRDAAAGTALNVGVIRGGSRPNVVAANAEAVIDVRVASSAEAARVAGALRALEPVDARTRLAVSGGIDRPPMQRSAGAASLFAIARAVAADLGHALGEGGTGGGSDGNLTAALGVPTLDGLGAVGGGAHAADEHVLVADLPWRAALLAGLLRRILIV